MCWTRLACVKGLDHVAVHRAKDVLQGWSSSQPLCAKHVPAISWNQHMLTSGPVPVTCRLPAMCTPLCLARLWRSTAPWLTSPPP